MILQWSGKNPGASYLAQILHFYIAITGDMILSVDHVKAFLVTSCLILEG